MEHLAQWERCRGSRKARLYLLSLTTHLFPSLAPNDPLLNETREKTQLQQLSQSTHGLAHKHCSVTHRTKDLGAFPTCVTKFQHCFCCHCVPHNPFLPCFQEQVSRNHFTLNPAALTLQCNSTLTSLLAFHPKLLLNPVVISRGSKTHRKTWSPHISAGTHTIHSCVHTLIPACNHRADHRC